MILSTVYLWTRKSLGMWVLCRDLTLYFNTSPESKYGIVPKWWPFFLPFKNHKVQRIELLLSLPGTFMLQKVTYQPQKSYFYLATRYEPSLVPRSEEEEVKGPGSNRSRMHLIITDLSTCWSVGGCYWCLQSHMVDCMTPLDSIDIWHGN